LERGPAGRSWAFVFVGFLEPEDPDAFFVVVRLEFFFTFLEEAI
jgi:hypothetical protein